MALNKRSQARLKVLRREGSKAASPQALARHAKEVARKRGPKQRHLSAMKAARTRKKAA